MSCHSGDRKGRGLPGVGMENLKNRFMTTSKSTSNFRVFQEKKMGREIEKKYKKRKRTREPHRKRLPDATAKLNKTEVL